MKRIYFLCCGVLVSVCSFAQTVLLPGGDMENWRSNMAGAGHPVTVEAPEGWYGADSLFIGLGQTIGAIVLGTDDSVWHRQLFKESSLHNSGSYSAKIMTTYQDTFLFPGVLSNAQAKVNITFTAPYITGVSYAGGTAVSIKPTNVYAWVQYYPGVDTASMPGLDTGLLTVQVLSHIAGVDSVIGIGTVLIPPCTSWTQINDTIIYMNDTAIVDTMRVTFTSSATLVPMDSSTLYVDDVTMKGVPQISHTGIAGIATAAEPVKVYPNPASGLLYLNCAQNAGLTCTLLNMSGAAVMTRYLTGNEVVDISNLPEGIYFYRITNYSGADIQKGKVSVVR